MKSNMSKVKDEEKIEVQHTTIEDQKEIDHDLQELLEGWSKYMSTIINDVPNNEWYYKLKEK